MCEGVWGCYGGGGDTIVPHSRLTRDRSPDGICYVGHIENDDLGRVADFFSDANKLVRLHGERGEPDVRRVDPHILKL